MTAPWLDDLSESDRAAVLATTRPSESATVEQQVRAHTILAARTNTDATRRKLVADVEAARLDAHMAALTEQIARAEANLRYQRDMCAALEASAAEMRSQVATPANQ
jgi:hypothetical protein